MAQQLKYLPVGLRALREDDLANFFEILRVFFANIPYDIQIKRESYCQSIFYLEFTMLGFNAEDA